MHTLASLTVGLLLVSTSMGARIQSQLEAQSLLAPPTLNTGLLGKTYLGQYKNNQGLGNSGGNDSGNNGTDNCPVIPPECPVVPPVCPPPLPPPPTPPSSGNNTNCSCDNGGGGTPNNSGGGNETEFNCTEVQVCRRYPQPYIVTDECGNNHTITPNITVCNFTDDATFDVVQFLTNMSYNCECDCAIYLNCTPIVPPSGGGGENCTVSCEDFQALQADVSDLNDQVSSLAELIASLTTGFSDLATRVSSLESRMTANDALIASIQSDIDSISSGSGVSISDVVSYVQSNGLWFGSNWWVGEYQTYLFAMDVASNTSYVFSPGTDREL